MSDKYDDIARSTAFGMPICDFGSGQALRAFAKALRRCANDARNEALETAAKIIDENNIVDCGNGKKYLAPRKDGTIDSLAYAAAIRALKQTGQEG